MAQANWRLEGEWLKNCNCAFGCPCDFNARPTQGYCKGLLGMQITKGNFEETRLDGLSFFVTVHFPGALHEGNGQAQPIIDERATPAQREAGRRHAVQYFQPDRDQDARPDLRAGGFFV
jgi:hypothetical protein